MNASRTVLLVCALSAMAGAQTQSFVLPSFNPVPRTNGYPFAGPKMRYQQWYSAAEWIAQVGKPVRVVGVEFRAGSPGGQVGKLCEVEVTMANALAVQALGTFDANFVSNRTLVVPRTKVMLGTAIPGSYPMQFIFNQEFVWDGSSGVVVDIRLYDNGNNNQPYQFDFESTVASPGKITRLYTVGDPSATLALNVKPGEGITTRFQYKEAISVPYGTGCKGAGNITPEASTSGGLPIPGNTAWTQVLTKAPSQRSATFVLGGSRTRWGPIPLPHELLEIGASGCFLLASPLALLTVTTVGGGAGAGQATVPLPVPPVTTLVGISLYSQWLVIDPAASNGVLTVSHGLWHIFAMS